MSDDKVKWEQVKKWVGREGLITKWKAYGMPEALDPFTSRFVDVEPMPRWEIPKKVMISTTITGAFFSKRTNPNQPITPDEIRASAEACIKAGAPNIHIHVRDEAGFNAARRRPLSPGDRAVAREVPGGDLRRLPRGGERGGERGDGAGDGYDAVRRVAGEHDGDLLRRQHVLQGAARRHREGSPHRVARFEAPDLGLRRWRHRQCPPLPGRKRRRQEASFMARAPCAARLQPDAQPAADGGRPHAHGRGYPRYRSGLVHHGLRGRSRQHLPRDDGDPARPSRASRNGRHRVAMAASRRHPRQQRRALPADQADRGVART